jgi:hypothetical protein
MLDNASDTLDKRFDMIDWRRGLIGKSSLLPDCCADRFDSGVRLVDGSAGVPDRMSHCGNGCTISLDDVSRAGGSGMDTLDEKLRQLDRRSSASRQQRVAQR